jgi:hypothetical protein
MNHVVSDPKAAASLARSFSRLGWCGFWSQIIVGAIPIALMIYLFVFARSTIRPRAGFALVEYLTIAALLILAFTTFWFFRYTRLAKRISDPDRPPAYALLLRSAWIGIVASVVGILFSILVMIIEVAHLLFYFLATPQGGVQVVQTTANESASWVSAVDMLSLMALILSLLLELIVLSFGLWLLFHTLLSANQSRLENGDQPSHEGELPLAEA